MKILLLVLLVASFARSDLLLRSQVTVEDLSGNAHLNNMIANTLNNKYVYFPPVEGLAAAANPVFSSAYEYKILQFSREKLDQAVDLLSRELGSSFAQASAELASTADERKSELWQTFIHLQVSEQLCRPTIALVRWDSDTRKFNVHLLKAKKAQPVEFQHSHLIRYTSLFGIEPKQATLIADASTEDLKAVYEVSKAVLLSAVEELAHRRGVDPKNPAAEVHFLNFMNKSPVLKADPVVVVAAVAAVVMTAAKIYQAFADAFSTKVTTTLIQELKSKGFSSYALKAGVRRYIGIQGTMLEQFTNIVSNDLTKSHPKKQKLVKATMDLVKFVPDGVFKMDDVAIDTAKPDNTDRFFTIVYNNEARGQKYNFMALAVDATFTLAPDLLVYKQSTSVAGGLFGSEKAIFKEVPRTVTDKDIEALRAFNLAMTVKMFSDNAGSKKLDWPKMP
jgi:hypothetical protein